MLLVIKTLSALFAMQLFTFDGVDFVVLVKRVVWLFVLKEFINDWNGSPDREFAVKGGALG